MKKIDLNSIAVNQSLPIYAADINTISLKENHYALRQEQQHRQLLTQLIFLIIFSSTAYAFVCHAIDFKDLFPGASTIFALTLISAFSLASTWIISSSGYPIKEFGLSIEGWQQGAKQAILFTIPLILLAIAGKWLYLRVTGNDFEALFEPTFLQPTFSILTESLIIISYIIFCPLQELIVRGVVQGILQKSLLGTEKNLWSAIILSNLTFAQVHVHLGIPFATLTFLAGLFWGWLYSRQKSIVGVSISHIIFGVFGQFILGTHFLVN